MTDHSALIARLETGPVYLTHKEAYDLAIFFGSDTVLGMASMIRKAFAGGSLDAALALAERVLEPVQGLGLLHAVIDLVGGNGLPSHRIAPLFCAAILKAKAQGEGG